MRRKPGVMAVIAIPKEPSFSVGFLGFCHGVASESELWSDDDGESDEFEHVKGHVKLSDGDERPRISAGSSKISHPASPFGKHLTWMASGDFERCLLKCGICGVMWELRLLHILLAISTILEVGQETSINPFLSLGFSCPFISVY